jgi:uncharacterized Zn-finger protein
MNPRLLQNNVGAELEKGVSSGLKRRTEWVSCPSCRKPFRAEIVDLPGAHAETSVDCPHCGAKAVHSLACWSITTHR